MPTPMSLSKFALSITVAGSIALAGCVSNDPEYQAQKQQQRAAAAENASALIKSEFGPLVPICLTALETGKIATEAEMAKLGYSPSFVVNGSGFKKKRGATTLDRINGTDTTFSVSDKACAFGLGNFAAVNPAGAFLASSLKSNGYADTGKSKKGFAFTKGGTTLYMNGFFYSSFTNVTISKG